MGLCPVGPPLTCPFGTVSSAPAPILLLSTAEENLSTPGPFYFLILFFCVKKYVTLDFHNGGASYLDIFH